VAQTLTVTWSKADPPATSSVSALRASLEEARTISSPGSSSTITRASVLGLQSYEQHVYADSAGSPELFNKVVVNNVVVALPGGKQLLTVSSFSHAPLGVSPLKTSVLLDIASNVATSLIH
jgi:hypothetical protein